MSDTPKLFQQCCDVYGWMLSDAEEKAEGMFWTGALTNLLTENGFNIGGYTSVTQKLIGMGCIEQIKRGGGRSPSVWCLITEPTLELFEATTSSKSGMRVSKKTARDNAIQALNERVSKLELVVERLISKEKARENN